MPLFPPQFSRRDGRTPVLGLTSGSDVGTVFNFQTLDAAVGKLDLAVDSLVSGGVPDGSITTAKLADAPNGVTTQKLSDGAVTDAKIATLSYAKLTGVPPPATVALTAPATPQPGQLWWRSDDGSMFVYYNDGSSSQWVPAVAATGGPVGPAGGDLSGTYPSPTLYTVGSATYRNAAISIPNATETVVAMDGEAWDRGNTWSPGTSDRVFLPVSGVYYIGVKATFNVSGTGSRYMLLRAKSGVVIGRHDTGGHASAWIGLQVSGLYATTDPTDYIQLLVWQNSGAALDLVSGGTQQQITVWRLAT